MTSGAHTTPGDGESTGLPLKYVAGHPSVDFVNTVDWTARGLVDERLDGYVRVTRWAEGAGVLGPGVGPALRDAAARHPEHAGEALAAAHRLRAVLQQVFAAAAAGRALGAELDAFTPFLAAAAAQRVLTPVWTSAPFPAPAGAPTSGGRLAVAPTQWAWRGAASDLTSPLWPVAWGAAELLASPEAARLRVCGAPDCGWMYVDRSRNGMRRWCQMAVCGTRAKSRRRAGRRDQQQPRDG